MIVLPNSFERYLSALRIFVSLSILKHGLQLRHLEKLKKIYKAEAFYNKNSQQSICIKSFCENLLNAVNAFKENLNYKCYTEGNFFINKNIFILLILEICTHSDYIRIVSSNRSLQLYFCSSKNNLSPFINALGGFSLFETKTHRSIIVIPVTKTTAPATKTETEWDWLFDKFSAVNLYFGYI